MASILPHNGKWRVFIDLKGIRRTKVCKTKTAANAWAIEAEAQILTNLDNDIPDKTFGDLLVKYRDEVTPTKAGARWEAVRINKYLNDPLAWVHLRDLGPRHFAEWRDRRLQEVEPASVLREWNILSNACKRAKDEWMWIKDHPMRGVSRPSKPPARTRIPTTEELERLKHVSGYRPDGDLGDSGARVVAAFLFSCETALRAGELAALKWHEVFLDKKYLKVAGIEKGAKKNFAAIRDVPLTARAIEILMQLKKSHSADTVFNISIGNLDVRFRDIRDRAAIDDLHYHDSRHVAITMLSKFYDVLALARIVGHSNIKELMTYYNPHIDDLVMKVA